MGVCGGNAGGAYLLLSSPHCKALQSKHFLYSPAMSWCLVLLRMRWKQLWSVITVGSTLVLSARYVCATQAGMTHRASLTPQVSFGTRLRHAHTRVSRARRANSNQQRRACANLVHPEQVLERQVRHVNRRGSSPLNRRMGSSPLNRPRLHRPRRSQSQSLSLILGKLPSPRRSQALTLNLGQQARR